jgi:hypothetical protein
MELNEISKKVKAEALAAGISEKRLDTDIVSANLPEKGKFVGYEIANPNQPTAHIRMIADDGSRVPVGNLKALAFFGNKETAKFRKVDNPESPINGGWVLTGTQAVNPNLGGKMPDVVAFLLNKEFTAEPLELLTLSVKSDNNKVVPFATEKQAKENLIVKKYFKVTLL